LVQAVLCPLRRVARWPYLCRTPAPIPRLLCTWFHVQQSAALGGDFWSRPDMRFLRDLALGYRWDGREFVALSEDDEDSIGNDDHHDVSGSEHHDVSGSEHHDVSAGARDSSLPQRYVPPSACDVQHRAKDDDNDQAEQQATLRSVNDWLRRHDALLAHTHEQWYELLGELDKLHAS